MSFSFGIQDISQNDLYQEAYLHLKQYLSQELIINVKQLFPTDGQNDVITIKSLSILTLDKFSETVQKYCEHDFANVNELLSGNAIITFQRAVREFITNTKARGDNAENYLLSGLLLYNGEPMKINEIKKNIFGEQENSEFENSHEIFQQIVEYILWSYCFFFRSNYTVIEFIQGYNLTLQQLILKKQQENEMQLLVQKKEVLEQIQKNMTKQSSETKKSQKKSKQEQNTTQPAN